MMAACEIKDVCVMNDTLNTLYLWILFDDKWMIYKNVDLYLFPKSIRMILTNMNYFINKYRHHLQYIGKYD